LIGPGLDVEAGKRAKRPGVGAAAQAHRVPQHAAGTKVAGEVEGGWLGVVALQRQVQTRDLAVGAAEGAEDQPAIFRG